MERAAGGNQVQAILVWLCSLRKVVDRRAMYLLGTRTGRLGDPRSLGACRDLASLLPQCVGKRKQRERAGHWRFPLGPGGGGGEAGSLVPSSVVPKPYAHSAMGTLDPGKQVSRWAF